MIYPENQVRNFYVVTGIGNTDKGNAKATVSKDGKFYSIKYIDANEKPITSDMIRTDCIRDIRISKPEGFKAYNHTITMSLPNAAKDGDTFMLYIDLKNVFNFGEGESYFYSYPVVKTSDITSAEDLAKKFAEIISKALKYNQILNSVFESVTASNGTLVFVERKQEVIPLRGIYAHAVSAASYEVKNGFAELKHRGDVNFNSTLIHKDGTTEKYVTSITVTDNTTNSLNNSVKVAAMERFFSKVRADLYGYNGYPDVNPSEMISTGAETKDFYFLDIKYYKDLHGVNVQKSEKEMTLVSTDITHLKGLLTDSTKGFSIIAETSVTTPDTNESTVLTPKITKPTQSSSNGNTQSGDGNTQSGE